MRTTATIVGSILALAALSACALRTPPAMPRGDVWEAEGLDTRGGAIERRLTASAGSVWRGGGQDPHRAVLHLPAPSRVGDVLWLRASLATAEAMPVRWTCGNESWEWSWESTGHGDRFEWRPWPRSPVSMAPVPESSSLQCDPSVRIDQVAWLAEGEKPSPQWSPEVHRDGELEILGSARATVFDPPWVFQILRRHQLFLETFLGADAPPVTLVAVAKEDWPDEGTGAFQSGALLYMPADQLHWEWRYYAHELCHVFQERWVAEVPLFFREGTAFLAEVESARQLYGREDSVAQRIAPLRSLTDETAGKGPSPNPVFDWESDVDNLHGGRHSYDWANAMVLALARAHGGDFVARVSPRLQDETDPQTQALQRATTERQRAWAMVRLLEDEFDAEWGAAFRRWGL